MGRVVKLFLREIPLGILCSVVRLSCRGILFFLLVLGGCTSQYVAHGYHQTKQVLKLENRHQVQRSSGWRLSTTTSIFLAKPAFPVASSSERNDYLRARFTLLQALEKELLVAYPKTVTSMHDLTLDQALVVAQQHQARILVYPRMLAYTDQPEGVSSSSLTVDQTLFQVLLVDVYSRELLDTGVVSSSGRLFASSAFANEMFTGAAQAYVNVLSGAKY